MNCSEARNRLVPMVLGELSATDRKNVEGHIGSCAVCEEIAKEVTGIDALCRDTFRKIRPPAGTVSSVKARIAAEDPVQRNWKWLAVAAGVVLFIGVLALVFSENDHVRKDQMADENEPKKVIRDQRPDPDPRHEEIPDDPNSGDEGKEETEEPAKLVLSTVSGMIAFEGDAPKPLEIERTADCTMGHGGKAYDESLLVSDNKMANVLVYIKEEISGGPSVKTGKSVRLEQKGCLFQPHVVALHKGQKLLITNEDENAHNVNFNPTRNLTMNFAQTKGDTRELTFEHAEIGMRIKCDIHPWMSAVVHVMKSPYFALTPASGQFQIPDLPVGQYTLVAWHEKLGEQEKEISVKEGEDVTFDFTFQER